jgi:hypothetical protein
MQRLLSHHEIATLLVLRRTPAHAQVVAPEVGGLTEVGLVRVVTSSEKGPIVELTPEGNAVLRTLDAC